jgi:hypothetical protein
MKGKKMNECPHIIGMSTCEICLSDEVNRLEAEFIALRDWVAVNDETGNNHIPDELRKLITEKVET